MGEDEWVAWHHRYAEDPGQAARLVAVQDQIRAGIDRAGPAPVRVVSLCSGDGRDLLGVLEGHPRASEVRARLIDLSPELSAAARDHAARVGLPGVEVRCADASVTDAWEGMVPAHLVLVCGIFGNVVDADIRNTVGHLPELCEGGATVIWTRGRFAPDLTPTIRRWFREAGFAELAFVPIPGTTASVGAARLAASPRPFRAGVRLFTFLPKLERPSQRKTAANASGAGASDVPP